MYSIINALSQGMNEVTTSYITHMYAMAGVNAKWGVIVCCITGVLLIFGSFCCWAYNKYSYSEGWCIGAIFSFILSLFGIGGFISLFATADVNIANAQGALYKIISSIF